MDACPREINAPLSEQGLYSKSGSVRIVDTSVLEAKPCRPYKNQEGHSTQDPEANWNVKAGSNAFRDGELKSTGTSFADILPPVPMFDENNTRARKKTTVLEKLRLFFEKYLGI